MTEKSPKIEDVDSKKESGVLPDLEDGADVSPAELALRARIVEAHEEKMGQPMEFTFPKVDKEGVARSVKLSDGSEVEGISSDNRFVHVRGSKSVTPVESILSIPVHPELESNIGGEVMKGLLEKQVSPEVSEVIAVEAEIKKMPEESRVNLSKGFHNIGFRLEHKKNEFFAKTFDWLAENRTNKEGTVAKFLSNLSQGFTRDAEIAKKNLEDDSITAKKYVSNVGLLLGNVIKYGRAISDATGLSLASPLRYVMAIGMAFSRGAEAAKETRFENEELLEKTRIEDAEKAFDEAMRIYDSATKDASGSVSPEALKQSYLKEMPKDLLERISRDPATANGFVQNVLRADIERSIQKLNESISKIEANNTLSPEDKENAKTLLLKKEEKNLRDYDRLITRYGTVDALALAGRYVNTAGKAVVGALTVETIVLSVDKLFGSLAEVGSHSSEVGVPQDHTRVVMPDSAVKTDTLDLGSVTLPSEPPALEMSNEEIARLSEAAPAEEVSASPESVPTLDELGIENIERGGSVSASIHAMVEKGEITKENFEAAWRNPASVVEINGEKVHISKVGLVYEGNQVKFVPGEAGAPGRFEVLKGSGPQFGTDRDLYARYQLLGKPAPSWLERSVGVESLEESMKEIPEAEEKNSMTRNQAFETGAPKAVEPAETTNAINPVDHSLQRESVQMVEAIFPNELMTEVPQVDSLFDMEDIYIQTEVMERWAESFDERSLLEQKNIVDALAPVEEYLRHIAEADLEESIRPDVEYAATSMLEYIEQMKEMLSETESLYQDKIVSLGFANYGEYQKALSENTSNLDNFLIIQEKQPDPRLAKLVDYIKELKPTTRELGMGLDSFIRSRVR